MRLHNSEDDDEISIVRLTAGGCDTLPHEQHNSQASECVAQCDGRRPSHRVTAKKYEFNPSPIRVKQGKKVQLKITATDHVHGFRIELFPDGSDTKKCGPYFLISAGLSEDRERLDGNN
jgi:hypothetical protein